MSAVAFSGDGSLVAGAVPGSVTLWDPHTNSLVAVLAHPAAAASVHMASLSFVPGTPYLVGCGILSGCLCALSCAASIAQSASAMLGLCMTYAAFPS